MWSYPVHQLLVLKADQSLSDEEQVGGSILHPDSTAQALINTGMKKFATNNQNSFVNVTLIRKCTSSFFLIITVLLINKYKNDTKKQKWWICLRLIKKNVAFGFCYLSCLGLSTVSAFNSVLN